MKIKIPESSPNGTTAPKLKIFLRVPRPTTVMDQIRGIKINPKFALPQKFKPRFLYTGASEFPEIISIPRGPQDLPVCKKI